MHVVDHQKTEPQEGEVRNVLKSRHVLPAAIFSLSEFNANDVDARSFLGLAQRKSLQFAVEGPNMSVEADVSAAIGGAWPRQTTGFICIAPVGAKVLGGKGVKRRSVTTKVQRKL